MAARTNEYQQPIGAALEGWTPRERPASVTLEGARCRIEPVDVERHAADLFEAYSAAPDGSDWTYLFTGPFSDFASFRAYLEKAAASEDPLHYAIIDRASGKAVGTFALMRIDPANGAIEVGSVTFSPLLKRTALSTEAQYLLMRYAFDQLGYRRYEWKCDSLNAPSRKTALRLGFQFEGIFRQAVVYKGRSRDTAWYAIIDHDWPQVKRAFETWLAPANFDAQGKQRASLASLRDA
ncbi:RimJ/RimL family protein N-acetyltransferase [Paraburkholderia bannensis]|uniref:RimJ/RimL family protein N-acetyltransferase n=1 Tax=Paraburkholderia bannensis TaxID=765414 RepID=A0A7W9U3J8_9BURK|nr:RimJ/RimL family protein N-acetyltransferase [Paraburkholderia sp. WP4_3_2]MBB6106398.1 RimJ/RimL family protein N-acetyltransferase [Paraburkholderia bannensis]